MRQLFGYDRADDSSLVPLMQAYWNPLQNLFTPVLKLKNKERVGGRVKIHDEPKTPYRRLLESPYVSEKEKARLKDIFRTKNPILLKRELDKKIKEYFQRVDHIKAKNRSVGS